LHVLNAPSPAATVSLAIAEHIVTTFDNHMTYDVLIQRGVRPSLRKRWLEPDKSCRRQPSAAHIRLLSLFHRLSPPDYYLLLPGFKNSVPTGCVCMSKLLLWGVALGVSALSGSF
jgi:hypothetical protein